MNVALLIIIAFLALAVGLALLEVHVAPAAREQREPHGEREERDDDQQGDVHRRSPPARARSRVSRR